MDKTRAGAGAARETTESRPRGLTKKAGAILLIVNGVILAAVPYVLRVRLEMSPDAVLLVQAASYAIFGAVLWRWISRKRREEKRWAGED